MSITLNRKLVLPFVAVATVSLTCAGVVAASADADPVTGGTATIDVSVSAATKLATAGVFVLPTKPATVTYDPVNCVVEYATPVVGGDASTNTLYGTLKLGGGLLIADPQTKRTVTLTNLTFDISDDTIAATPSTGGDPIVLFDALGNHDYTTTQPETFSASSVRVDAAGAKFLNKALHASAFKKGAVIGTFNTSFSNSNDG